MAKKNVSTTTNQKSPARKLQATAPAPTPEEILAADEPRYWQFGFAILLMAILLRQLWLAQAPYHHDEAIHAWFTTGFAGYRYDPTYHGPLLYHLVAIVFGLFGVNDYTGRLVPSLLGIALIVMALGPLRRWLGPRAALWSAALLAISPVLVTYHRRLLHDALVMVLTLGAVLCLQTALENSSHTRRGRLARIGLAALLALFVATKANAFFIMVMLLGFWLMVKLRPWLRGFFAKAGPPPGFMAGLPLILFIVVSITSVIAVREPDAVKERNELLLMVVFVISCVAMWLWLALGTYVGEPEKAPPNEETADAPAPSGFDWLTPVLAAAVAVFLFAFFYGHGYLWWKIPLQLAENPELALSTVRTNMAEAQQALPKMLEYWGNQQKNPRLPSRHDYYIPLMVLYELPIVLAAIAAIVRAGRRRSLFTDLLLWWAFTSFVLYSLANEKVPWLLTHIILPLALLAAWWLAQLRFNTAQKRAAFAVWCGLGAIFLLRGASGVNFERGADHHEPLVFAQISETAGDAFMDALRLTQNDPSSIWVHGERQWPPAWYLRAGAPYVNGKAVQYSTAPNTDKLRMVLAPPEVWAEEKRVAGWNGDTVVDFLVWPRASWPALNPDVFARFWWNRMATVENGVLAPPGEWSSAKAVVGVPPSTE